jgi:hypothetical protein
VDTSGDVGRFSSLVLDPNRPTITRWTIGYEDTSHGDYRYAIQGDFDGGKRANGFTNYLVANLAEGGGYTSLAYYDAGANSSKRYQPAMSFYDAGETALRYAESADGGAKWSTAVVASKDVQGLYTDLLFDDTGHPNIFYYNRTNNEAVRAVLKNHDWVLDDLRAGGREIHVAMNRDGMIAYSSLNEKDAELSVHVI